MRLEAAIVLCVAVISSACSATREAVPDAVHVAEVAIQKSLDSCYAMPAGPDSSAAARDSASKAPRMTGRIANFKGFSLFVPSFAPQPSPRDSGFDISGLPWCPRCNFGVSVASDAGISLEKRVADRIASQKHIDSLNDDPNNFAREFDEMDGPPTPIAGRAGRGYAIDNNCGDCMSVTVNFWRPGRIATIDYGFVDDASMPWRHHCEMSTLATSFAFRE